MPPHCNHTRKNAKLPQSTRSSERDAHRQGRQRQQQQFGILITRNLLISGTRDILTRELEQGHDFSFNYKDASQLRHYLTLVHNPISRSHTLVFRDTGGQTAKFTFPAILIECALSLNNDSPGSLPAGFTPLQSAWLYGMDTEAFSTVLGSIQAIDSYMLSRLRSTQSTSRLVGHAFGLNNVIKASKPWFTPIVKLDPGEGAITFPPSENNSIVERYAEEGLLYTQDNQVEYEELISNEDDQEGTFVPCPSHIFRPAQVVNATVSFRAISRNGDQYQVVCILEALALLNDSACHTPMATLLNRSRVLQM
ncbi:hypothetical protein CPB86DRAFT_859108 [Serendipita vermifera]|nr:hypothetical protein CPB86DRAFT_859108 [Serendipita vermifera]